jgi:hypothetical protein
MTQVISPTPGCIVWYTPAPHDGIATRNNQPLAALVADVHNDRLVNLAVFDSYGNTQQRSNVTLVQSGDAVPDSAHATWMPFQVGQAAKHQAVETAVLDALITGTGVVQAAIDPSAFFAETDGASASEADLVNEQITDSVAQSPAADEAAPSSSEPAQA